MDGCPERRASKTGSSCIGSLGGGILWVHHYQQEQPKQEGILLLVFHCQVIRYGDERRKAKAEKQSKYKEDVSKDIALSDCNRS